MSMNERQVRLTVKNLSMWSRRVKKLKAKEALTDIEKDELEMRSAQCVVWAHQLKTEGVDLSAPDAPGDMSASAGVATSESAGASA